MIDWIASMAHRAPRLPQAISSPGHCVDCRERRVELVPAVRALEELAQCFRRHGGLLDGDELAGTQRPDIAQPISHIARLIVARRIVSLDYGTRRLVPLFQFQPGELAVRPEFTRIRSELVDVLDDGEVAHWFGTGNSWLEGESPVAVFSVDAESVREAARADRFLLRGC